MSPQPTILVVDDEKHTRDGLRSLLENEYDVYVAPDIAGAINVLECEQIDVLLTDLRLGSEDGMTLIDRALKMPRPPACIMMTAYGSVDVAVEAMKRGAYDFVTKPLNLDKVELLIARAVQGRKLEQENRALREQVDERYGLENIWGDSAALHEMLDTIRQVAPSSANVLIEGESGTGKELAAHAIHNLSRRNKAKFVAVHCAALSPQLLESELFGHEKGAFTGAYERRIGRQSEKGFVVCHAEVAQESAYQNRDIFLSFAQWRHGNAHHVQAKIKIVAKFSFAHQLFEIFVRGCNYPYICVQRLIAANSLECAALAHDAQQFDLSARVDLSHFVEENRAPVGLLEPADAPFVCAGERAFLVTE
jgi:FixJ family two-component response regulator